MSEVVAQQVVLELLLSELYLEIVLFLLLFEQSVHLRQVFFFNWSWCALHPQFFFLEFITHIRYLLIGCCFVVRWSKI